MGNLTTVELGYNGLAGTPQRRPLRPGYDIIVPNNIEQDTDGPGDSSVISWSRSCPGYVVDEFYSTRSPRAENLREGFSGLRKRAFLKIRIKQNARLASSL